MFASAHLWTTHLTIATWMIRIRADALRALDGFASCWEHPPDLTTVAESRSQRGGSIPNRKNEKEADTKMG